MRCCLDGVRRCSLAGECMPLGVGCRNVKPRLTPVCYLCVVLVNEDVNSQLPAPPAKPAACHAEWGLTALEP